MQNLYRWSTFNSTYITI